VSINYIHGLLLLLLFFYYIYNLIVTNKINDSNLDTNNSNLFNNIILIICSILSLGFGTHLLVDNAIEIATLLGFSSMTTGVTIVALGTSLPELFTGVLSVKKKHYNLLIGNVIGSNVINIVFVLGFSSIFTVIKPSFDYVSLNYITIIFILSHLILIFSYLFSKSISKFSGFILLVLYLIFLYKIF
tara:strand:- start:69 stop:629 length:561 start_codon:yes stop_codon:yes gene_type:complete